ncbi:MAG TPA: hypothetical protein PLX89_25900 [Verrucomicrobiota bacterium]|nr:hypothetical protein [Verrucomicrobiota bacterium]
MNTPTLSSASVSLEQVDETRRFAEFSRFLADKDRVSRLSLLVASISLLVALVSIGLALYFYCRPIIFVVVDAEGNVIALTGAPFQEARELHVKQAMLATTALLSRNPRGFDQPEFLEAMFSKSALAAAGQLKDAEAREFADRQIQQKPQISRIDAITNHRNEVQVQVVGEVARWGFVQQVPFSDSIPFTLRLVLRSNPDLLRKGQQPLIVENFELTYATPTR